MKVLVTGGTGVIGAGAIPEILAAGHQVRLLSRGAKRDAKEYPQGVEPFPADIGDPAALRGAAQGCRAVVHISGIVEEQPPETTFEKVNVEGTRHILGEAAAAGVTRFIFLSSLGADRGQSAYHESKRRAEELVRGFAGDWVILRPGNVYGPGDDVISALLKMTRSLPVVPVIEGGAQPFQPIWFEDLGRVIAMALTDLSVPGEILELAGLETTSTNDVLERLKEITGRDPARLNISSGVAAAAVTIAGAMPVKSMADKAGVSIPLNEAKLQMLLEANVIQPPARNALLELFQNDPTPLAEGLRLLADQLPELLPSEGIGSMERKRFTTVVPGVTPEHLMKTFRERLLEVMPLEFSAEPGAPVQVEQGAVLTAAIPGRGNIQVRVEEDTPRRVTFATLEGHPLAGVVSFIADDAPAGAMFSVEIHARAANVLDWIAARTIGRPMQNQNWKTVVARVAELASGRPSSVDAEIQTLEESEATEVERWVERMVQARKLRERVAAG